MDAQDHGQRSSCDAWFGVMLAKALNVWTRLPSRWMRSIQRHRHLAVMMLLLALSSPSSAHTTWQHGEPIPEWVSKACCGSAEAHWLRPDQVHRTNDGYRIEGYPRAIFDAQVLPSEDGEYWAFYSEYRDSAGLTDFTSVYCFFAPTFG